MKKYINDTGWDKICIGWAKLSLVEAFFILVGAFFSDGKALLHEEGSIKTKTNRKL